MHGSPLRLITQAYRPVPVAPATTVQQQWAKTVVICLPVKPATPATEQQDGNPPLSAITVSPPAAAQLVITALRGQVNPQTIFPPHKLVMYAIGHRHGNPLLLHIRVSHPAAAARVTTVVLQPEKIPIMYLLRKLVTHATALRHGSRPTLTIAA